MVVVMTCQCAGPFTAVELELVAALRHNVQVEIDQRVAAEIRVRPAEPVRCVARRA